MAVETIAVLDGAGNSQTINRPAPAYVEDEAAASDPRGHVPMLVRRDTLSASEVSADGDNVAQKGTSKGEAYTKDSDAAALLTTIDADTGNAVTALQIMDDWDESDRAKVNLIVGQAGIAAGAGAVGATVPRVTVASDSPLMASLGSTTSAAAGVDQNGDLIAQVRQLTKTNAQLVASLGLQPVSGSSAVTAKSGGPEYETVAASQTNQTLGPTGATGDYLEGVLCVVSTAATSQVQIKDGAGSAITVLPNNVGAGVGSYYVPLGLTSVAGAWQITTAAGVAVVATGDFT